MKAFAGRYFEDFAPDQRFVHPVPRTVHGGDLAMYIGLTGDRRALSASTEFARGLGYQREVAHDLLVFHLVFGKSVIDISQNAVANLGYADVRFLQPVYPGDTLHADSQVLGLRETSGKDSGVVTVRTRGLNQRGQEVVTFIRWVLVPKRDPKAQVLTTAAPTLPTHVPADALPIPSCLNLQRFNDLAWATGGRARWADYQVGERIDHLDGMTLEEADHVTATRLYHNGARVHFDAHLMATSRFGKRLIYGGHVASVAMALSHNGLEHRLGIAAWNAGVHAAPSFAGDTLYAWTEVVESAPLRDDLGALRLRLFACKNVDPRQAPPAARFGDDGKLVADPSVVLGLDYWALIPR